MRDFRSNRYNNNKPRRDFARQYRSTAPQMVNMVFRELVDQVLEKIKNEPYFKWPNKMEGNPMRSNQSLQCQYHQDQGHTTENCRTRWYHLKQLVRDGKLKQFLYRPNGQGDQAGSGAQGNVSSRPHLGTINVIFAALGRIGSHPSRVISVTRLPAEDLKPESKRARVENRPAMSFSEEDKVGTIQPHDDALVVTLKIGGMVLRG